MAECHRLIRGYVLPDLRILQSPVIHNSISVEVVRITGIALRWIGLTTSFASYVRKPNSSCSPVRGFLCEPRSPIQDVQMPAKKAIDELLFGGTGRGRLHRRSIPG